VVHTDGRVQLKGQADNINTHESKLKWQTDKLVEKKVIRNPDFLKVLDIVFTISRHAQFNLIGHRVVHGGEMYTEPTKIDMEVLNDLEKICSLAPKHNPIQVFAMKQSLKMFSGIPQAAIFDTAYYGQMPRHAFLYAVPYKWYTDHQVRKYGFHGTSHLYISREAARRLGKDISELCIVSCHLGAGCSVTATKGGVGVDTSMGFTPLTGVMMGSRSGDIDPSVIPHLEAKTGLSSSDIMAELNNNSGLMGITGTPDSLAVENLALQNDPRGVLAVEMYCYSIAKYVASFIVPLGKIDALVFSGGVGEKSSIKREKIINYLSGLGFTIDEERNNSHGSSSSGLISRSDGSPPVLVVNTNEELVIAQLTSQLYAHS